MEPPTKLSLTDRIKRVQRLINHPDIGGLRARFDEHLRVFEELPENAQSIARLEQFDTDYPKNVLLTSICIVETSADPSKDLRDKSHFRPNHAEAFLQSLTLFEKLFRIKYFEARFDTSDSIAYNPKSTNHSEVSSSVTLPTLYLDALMVSGYAKKQPGYAAIKGHPTSIILDSIKSWNTWLEKGGFDNVDLNHNERILAVARFFGASSRSLARAAKQFPRAPTPPTNQNTSSSTPVPEPQSTSASSIKGKGAVDTLAPGKAEIVGHVDYSSDLPSTSVLIVREHDKEPTFGPSCQNWDNTSTYFKCFQVTMKDGAPNLFDYITRKRNGELEDEIDTMVWYPSDTTSRKHGSSDPRLYYDEVLDDGEMEGWPKWEEVSRLMAKASGENTWLALTAWLWFCEKGALPPSRHIWERRFSLDDLSTIAMWLGASSSHRKKLTNLKLREEKAASNSTNKRSASGPSEERPSKRASTEKSTMAQQGPSTSGTAAQSKSNRSESRRQNPRVLGFKPKSSQRRQMPDYYRESSSQRIQDTIDWSPPPRSAHIFLGRAIPSENGTHVYHDEAEDGSSFIADLVLRANRAELHEDGIAGKSVEKRPTILWDRVLTKEAEKDNKDAKEMLDWSPLRRLTCLWMWAERVSVETREWRRWAEEAHEDVSVFDRFVGAKM